MAAATHLKEDDVFLDPETGEIHLVRSPKAKMSVTDKYLPTFTRLWYEIKELYKELLKRYWGAAKTGLPRTSHEAGRVYVLDMVPLKDSEKYMLTHEANAYMGQPETHSYGRGMLSALEDLALAETGHTSINVTDLYNYEREIASQEGPARTPPTPAGFAAGGVVHPEPCNLHGVVRLAAERPSVTFEDCELNNTAQEEEPNATQNEREEIITISIDDIQPNNVEDSIFGGRVIEQSILRAYGGGLRLGSSSENQNGDETENDPQIQTHEKTKEVSMTRKRRIRLRRKPNDKNPD